MTDNSFQENGYKLIKNVIDPAPFYQHLRELEEKGKGLNDTQVAGSRIFYKDQLFEKLLSDLLPVLEEHAGVKLFKTYSFARQYVKENILRSHYDRNACEISVTVSLGHEEEPWPLWILDKDEIARSFKIEPGDAFMFKGIENAHWRERNVFGKCSQVFLHYVDQNGPYAIHKDDRNAGNWFKVRLFKREFKFSIMPSYSK